VFKLLVEEEALSFALGFSPAERVSSKMPIRVAGGRLWLNLSVALHFSSLEKLADLLSAFDQSTSDAMLTAVDPAVAKAAAEPPYFPWRVLSNRFELPANVARSILFPAESYQRQVAACAGLWEIVRQCFRVYGLECAEEGASLADTGAAAGRGGEGRAGQPAGCDSCVCCTGCICCCACSFVPARVPELAAFVRDEGVEGVEGGDSDGDLPPPPSIKRLLQIVLPYFLQNVVVGLVPGVITSSKAMSDAVLMLKDAPAELRQQCIDAGDLRCGVMQVTTQLGMLIEDMVALIEEERSHDAGVLTEEVVTEPHALLDVINRAAVPQKILDMWQLIMEQFGHRGFREIDMRAESYADRPERLVAQVVSMLAIPAEQVRTVLAPQNNMFSSLNY
jgi:hypothetical protein